MHPRNEIPRHRRGIVLLALLSGLLLVLASPAAAQFHVTQPDMKKGEATIGDHAAIYDGPGTDERLDQGHEFEGTYDFTNRLGLVAKWILQEPVGGDLETKNYQLGPQIALLERHGEGVGLAFRTLYQFTVGESDEIIFGPMARAVTGKNSATINTFFSGDVEDDSGKDGLELKINWQLRHDFRPSFGLGIEGYADIKDLAHAGTFDDQLHRIGPVLYLDLRGHDSKELLYTDDRATSVAPSLRLATGVLFGLTEATSDVTYKIDLSAAF